MKLFIDGGCSNNNQMNQNLRKMISVVSDDNGKVLVEKESQGGSNNIKGNFSKYAGIIKRFGMFQVRIWINEMKQKGISSPRYFWGIVKQTFKRLKK